MFSFEVLFHCISLNVLYFERVIPSFFVSFSVFYWFSFLHSIIPSSAILLSLSFTHFPLSILKLFYHYLFLQIRLRSCEWSEEFIVVVISLDTPFARGVCQYTSSHIPLLLLLHHSNFPIENPISSWSSTPSCSHRPNWCNKEPHQNNGTQFSRFLSFYSNHVKTEPTGFLCTTACT